MCIPEDERGSALAPQCHCRIPGTDFRRAWFFLALEVNGTGAGLEALVKAEQQGEVAWHLLPRLEGTASECPHPWSLVGGGGGGIRGA